MEKKHILMVDDDPMILRFMSANLQARGYKVTTALDGESALQMARELCPDLVILDVLMPGIDGFEVCRRLREWSGVPILVLTAIGETNARWQFLQLGANDYMAKPFDIAELLKRVHRLLESGPSPLNLN